MSGIMSMLLGAVSSAAGAVDEFFNRVTLLLPGNGTNGAQNNTFLDSSSNNFTITRNGNTTQGTFSPFSQTGWSNFLNGDYLAGSTNLFSTTISTFTIEAWLYPTALNSALGENIIIGDQDPIGATLTLSSYINNSGQVVLGWYDGASKTCVSADTISLNQWSYVAIVVNSNSISMYVNSTTASSLTGTTTLTNRLQTNNFTIGMYAASFRTARWVGYLSNIRVSTVARSISSIPTAPYTSDANTRLLTCQSNRFVDNSSNAFAITPSGTPSVQAFSPFAPTAAYSAATVGGSGYFDAAGDYLDSTSTFLPSSSTSTFTIEAYFYPTSFTNKTWLIGDMGASGNYLSLNVNTSGTLELYWFDGSVKTYTTTGAVQLNAWNYIAAVVNSNAISLYLNSSSPAAATGTSTLTNRSGQFTFNMGTNSGSTTPNGFVSNVRVSTTARTISIPTAPYTSDANTRWLLNFTNAGITDATAKNDLETVGNAQISTTQSKFGGSSIAFDGSGDYLIPNTAGSNALYALGTGDFTIETWVYPTSFTGQTNVNTIFDFRPASTNGIYPTLFLTLTNGYLTYFVNNSNVITTTSTPTLNTWSHVALVRSSGSTRLYLNGTQVGSTYTDTNNYLGSASRPLIGTSGFFVVSDFFTGYMDDFRITRFARYTANFTPTTTAFPLQ
jgi:NADPH-dependent 7-cyano-7-deazaguanine reductase QueF-like protein